MPYAGTEALLINSWIETDDPAPQPTHGEAGGGQATRPNESLPLPGLARLIGGTGNILVGARSKLASWFSGEGDWTRPPHIDL
jgi:hypothetical protein